MIRLGSHGPLVSAWQHEMLRTSPCLPPYIPEIDGLRSEDQRQVVAKWEVTVE